MAACCNLCASVTICNAFTYIESSQACWLKYNVGTPSAVVGRISGVVSSRSTFPSTLTSTTASTTTISTTSSSASATKVYGCFIENNINYYGFDFFANYVSSARYKFLKLNFLN